MIEVEEVAEKKVEVIAIEETTTVILGEKDMVIEILTTETESMTVMTVEDSIQTE